MSAKTQADLLFEDYLTGIGLTADFEPPLGRKRPDYLVHARPGDVLCEVEEFGEGEIDRNLEEQLRVRGIASGAIDPYRRIRDKLNIAGDQLREFKGRYPGVVVLHNPGRLVILDTEIVQGAMYGNIGVVLGIDPSGQRPPVNRGVRFDPKSAKLRSRQNTIISAVAVLERIRPNAHMIDRALAETRTRRAGSEWPTPEPLKQAPEEAEKVRLEHPEVDDVALRLRVVHNPYAALVLPDDTFSGPYDEHYALDRVTSRFVRKR